jgi:hypothetical protein
MCKNNQVLYLFELLVFFFFFFFFFFFYFFFFFPLIYLLYPLDLMIDASTGFLVRFRASDKLISEK